MFDAPRNVDVADLSDISSRPRTDDLLVAGQRIPATKSDPNTMLGLLSPLLDGPSDPEGHDPGESTRLAPVDALAGPSLASDLDLGDPPAMHTQAGVMVYGAAAAAAAARGSVDEASSGARIVMTDATRCASTRSSCAVCVMR